MAALTLSQDIGQMQTIKKMRKKGLAMIHTQYDMVINMEKTLDICVQLHTRKLVLKTLL